MSCRLVDPLFDQAYLHRLGSIFPHVDDQNGFTKWRLCILRISGMISSNIPPHRSMPAVSQIWSWLISITQLANCVIEINQDQICDTAGIDRWGGILEEIIPEILKIQSLHLVKPF